MGRRGMRRRLLPDAVLRTRPGRTGITAGYFQRSMRDVHAQAIADTLADSVLVELGVVDGDVLERARTRFMRSGSEELGLRLFLTMQAELWVRRRVGWTAGDAVRGDVRGFAMAVG